MSVSMSYRKEREQFIALAAREGLSMPVITRLLRYASTLQRLAVAQCNGDWPYNGDRDRPSRNASVTEILDTGRIDRWNARYTVCPKCEASGVAKSALRRSFECRITPSGIRTTGDKLGNLALICPDCRTQELVNELLNNLPCMHGRNQESLGEYCLACPYGDKAVRAVFEGDPRGAVLRLSTPNYPYDATGAGGRDGLYVPAR